MKTLSTYAVARIYRKAYAKLAEGGGTEFGLDWRTCASACPYWTSVLRSAFDELRRRSQLSQFTTVSA